MPVVTPAFRVTDRDTAAPAMPAPAAVPWVNKSVQPPRLATAQTNTATAARHCRAAIVSPIPDVPPG